MEGKYGPSPHSQIGLDFDALKLAPQFFSHGAEIFHLDGKTLVGLSLKLLSVPRAAVVRDEDDAFQLVYFHQESQLFEE